MDTKTARNRAPTLAVEKNIRLAAVGMTKRKLRKLHQSGAGKVKQYRAVKLLKDWYPHDHKNKKA